MPFTPFHFGPSACVALPLRKHLDVPVFVLANVVVDLEPLAVMLFDLDYPIHGYVHTLLVGALAGVVWAVIAWFARGIIERLMNLLCLPYRTSFSKILISAILGVWLHVLLDATIYADVRLLYPFYGNPLYRLLTVRQAYWICTAAFAPAVAFYILAVLASRKERQARNCPSDSRGNE